MSQHHTPAGEPDPDSTTAFPAAALRRPAGSTESARANRTWWDGEAASYQRENAAVLGDRRLMWGPEGVYEDELGLLGALDGARVLEFGSGAGQGARWCADQGASVIASDLSLAMLRHGARTSPASVSYLQADAMALPVADACVDVAFSAFGAPPFLPDVDLALIEVARTVRPGGRIVFSVSHPFRWALPDVAGDEGLTVRHSYFDRRAYVEEDDTGRAVYAEHHHTMGDWIAAIAAADLRLRALVEPEWPSDAGHVWGGWSRLRGELIPGTAIFVLDKPEAHPGAKPEPGRSRTRRGGPGSGAS